MQRICFALALVLSPLVAAANPTRVTRPDVLAQKPSFSYTVFVRRSAPNSLDHHVSLDGAKVRSIVGNRAITKLKVIASTPNEAGAWRDVELGVDPSHHDLQAGARFNFARTVGLRGGLTEALRHMVDLNGAAYRAEVTTSDGATTIIDLQRVGRNVLPNNRGWVGSPSDR